MLAVSRSGVVVDGVIFMQECAQARGDQEDGSGAILRCLVAANESISTPCLREVQRTVASGLMLYQPVSLLNTVKILCALMFAACCTQIETQDQTHFV